LGVDVCSGIVSSVFTQTGEGFYLVSPSEMARFSVSAHVVTRPCCVIRRHATAQESSVHRPYGSVRQSTPQQTPANQHQHNDVSPRYHGYGGYDIMGLLVCIDQQNYFFKVMTMYRVRKRGWNRRSTNIRLLLFVDAASVIIGGSKLRKKWLT